MKRAKLAGLALCLLVVTWFTGCTSKLKGTADGLIDTRTGLIYQHASVVYKPVETGKKHGTLQVTDNFSVDVYRIEGLDPDQWLVTEDGDILYAQDVTLPTLTDMAPSAFQICQEDTSLHILRRVSEGNIVSALVTAYETGSSITYPSTMPVRSYTIRFESQAYPALLYCLTYVEYGSDLEYDGVSCGKYFLYSAFDSRFVPVGEDIHNIVTQGTANIDTEVDS